MGAYNLILHIHVVVNWQLSKRVSADQYNMAIRGNVFFKLSADKLLVFQLTASSTPSEFLSYGYKFVV